jgi:hypothetical protein
MTAMSALNGGSPQRMGGSHDEKFGSCPGRPSYTLKRHDKDVDPRNRRGITLEGANSIMRETALVEPEKRRFRK